MSKYYCGIDIGSSFSKCVILDEDKNIVSSSIIRTKPNLSESANLVVSKTIKNVSEINDINDFNYIVGTGYERVQVEFADENLSVMSCHAKGVHILNPGVRIAIDIGGQGLKCISISENGDVDSYKTNEKCRAGIGKFYEQVVRCFDISLEEFSELSLSAKKVCEFSMRCNVYAQDEVTYALAQKKPAENVAMGIQFAIAKRCYEIFCNVGLSDDNRINSDLDITLTGGCAKNLGLIYAVEKIFNKKIVKLQSDPQLMGALGAALFAHERSKSKDKEFIA